MRIRLRKRKMLKLKVRQTVGRAFTPDEKDRMLEEAGKARSPHIFPALSLALNAGMRDAEIKTLRWDRSTSQRNTWPWARARPKPAKGGRSL